MKKRTSQSLRVSPEKLDTVKKAWKNHRCNSQEAFAESLGMRRGTFSKFLKGTDPIYQDNFIKICEALKLDWQEIADLPKYAETQPHEHQNKQATVETEFAIFSTPNAPANNAFTSEWWREVCRTMLKNHQKQKLTTNPLNSCDKQLKDIFVPLGLIERWEKPRPAPDIPAEQGSELYHYKITPISHQEFFEKVIKHGQSQKSKGRRIANIGEPGAGKTTLLQTIAFQVLENYELPIWVDLADLGQNESLEDYILLRWLKEALPIIHRLSPQIAPHQVSEELKEALKQEFCNGKVWLLLDGVDEMPAELGNPLTVISKQLKGWIAEARVVLSCRLNVWDADKNALTDFDVYRNLDFSYPDEVREFIQKWFVNKADKAKGLIAELEQSTQRIQDLIKNPLRLTLLCRTWERMEGKLPDTKAGIYQRLVEAHYQWKDDKQDFEISLDKRRELNKALGELARKAIDDTDSRFRLRESFIKGFLGERDQEKSLFWWALKLGWLNRVGLATAEEKDSDEKVYAFFHPTFQEYFAALAIDDWNFFLNHNNENPNPFGQYKDKDCVYRIFEPQWKEVFLLWLGRCDVESRQKEEFIEALINFKDDCQDDLIKRNKGFYEYRAYFCAAAAIAEFKNSKLADEIVQNLIKFALGTEITQSSLPPDIIEELVKQGNYRVSYAPYLMKEKAKAVFQETDRSRAIHALIEVIRMNSVKDILREPIEILGDIGKNSHDVKALLIELTDNYPDDYTRLKAAESLAKIDQGSQQVISTLRELQNSEDDYIRYTAISNLAKISPTHLAHPAPFILTEPTLFLHYFKAGCFGSSKAEIVEWFIDDIRCPSEKTDLLGTVKDLGYLATPGDIEAIQVLIELIHTRSDNSSLMMETVQSLARIGKNTPETISFLINILQKSEDVSLHFQVIRALSFAEVKYEEVIQVLMNIIMGITADDLNRYTAAHSLAEILKKYPSTSAVSRLKEYLLILYRQKDFNFYQTCYNDILLECAQHLPYPDFYKAWHPPSTHQANQKITGTTPLIQSLNQAILPQDIRAAIEPELSQKIHPVCIDISEWIDINNPSLEIYDQMTGQGCLETPQNQPDTLQKLKLYFKNLNKTEKIYFLIFYKSNSEPQEIPQTLLTALSKFGPEIALITDQPLTNLNLKQFSSTLPITPIVGWMREIVMET